MLKSEPKSTIFGVWRELTKADLTVWLAIVELDEQCLQSDIANLTGLSTRQVIRSIRALKKVGILAVSRDGRRNVYHKVTR